MMMVENTGAPLADLAGTNPSSGTARYYLGDLLGSTRRLRNASKTSLGQYEYQPYGEIYSETGATPKYKFAGMYYAPDLAHYYTLNRFYNPTLARWTTRDPLRMADGPNMYAYVTGDPVNLFDAVGLARIIASLCVPGFWGPKTKVSERETGVPEYPDPYFRSGITGIWLTGYWTRITTWLIKYTKTRIWNCLGLDMCGEFHTWTQTETKTWEETEQREEHELTFSGLPDNPHATACATNPWTGQIQCGPIVDIAD